MPNSINLDIGFFTHPKTVRLMTLAGTGSEARLIQLWCYVAEHRPDTGGFDDWTPEEVEAAAHWSGEKGLFVETLLKCGWIHQRENNEKTGFYMHDWKERQPHLVKYTKVSQERRKAINKRWDMEKKRGKYKSSKGLKGDTKGILIPKFECSNLRFCNTNAVQCNAMHIPLLSPSEIESTAARIADYYAVKVKPKSLDRSGSRKVFIGTLKTILSTGTQEACLVKAIDNYLASLSGTEKRTDDIVYRHGLQSFFGPKNQYWIDFLNLPAEEMRLHADEFASDALPDDVVRELMEMQS